MHCLFIIVMFLLSNVVVNSEIKCEIKTHKKIEQPDCENNDVKMRKWLEKTKVVEWLKKKRFFETLNDKECNEYLIKMMEV